MTDIAGNSHEGMIYMGPRGIVAALLGLVAIALGVVLLLRASNHDA